HRLCDVHKMLKELAGHVFVSRVVESQLQRHSQQVERVHRHPACAVGLLQKSARGQGLGAVENTDVVQAQKAALKKIVPLGVLAVHPPGEVQQQLVKNSFQKLEIALAGALSLDL